MKSLAQPREQNVLKSGDRRLYILICAVGFFIDYDYFKYQRADVKRSGRYLPVIKPSGSIKNGEHC